MKVLLINGSPHEKGCTYTALKEISDELNRNAVETEIFHIGSKAIRGCMGCESCGKRKDGKCNFDDDCVNEVIDKINASDALIVGSPVHYAAASGAITSLLDRVFYGIGSFKLKPAAAIVSCRRGGASAAFEQLIKYFTIAQMPVVSSQYWNSVHGNTPEEVLKDGEGLQTMRTLARNMAWLLKSIEAGRLAGIKEPETEARIGTNFIR